MKKDEAAYLARDNIIFNTPSIDSLESSSYRPNYLLHAGYCHPIHS